MFSEFLEDISEDVLPNEATGFRESKIWNLLYNFQKDAVLAIINKWVESDCEEEVSKIANLIIKLIGL